MIVQKKSGLIAIIGSKESQFMNILTLNKNNLEPVLQLKLSNVIDDYPDVFKDELGQLPGEACYNNSSILGYKLSKYVLI